jgi:hypothetical protein
MWCTTLLDFTGSPIVEAGEDVSAHFLAHVSHTFRRIGLPPNAPSFQANHSLLSHMVSYNYT